MLTLGVHIGHDASAALIRNGTIVADVAEERFIRIKHYAGIPFQAIEYCLAVAGSASNIDCVAFSGSTPARSLDRLFTGVRLPVKKSARGSLPLYRPPFQLRRNTSVRFIAHHAAHAASAYFTSGWPRSQRSLVVTLDGVGDGISAGVWRGHQGRLECLHQIDASGSIGWFYSNVTEALGWWHGDAEGKTMGLAPYGDPDVAQRALARYFPRFADGYLSRSHDFGEPSWLERAGAVHWHLDDAKRIQELLKKFRREDLAAAAQAILEREVMNLVLPWLEREQTDHLACAGGVFLNVKLNQRVWYSGRVRQQHVYPNAGDSGLAVGAALAAHYEENPSATLPRLGSLYWGPKHSASAIERTLRQRKLSYSRPDRVETVVAEALARNEIVGWFQGRMESGPRALGNRSILMSAARAKNKAIINGRVKFREAFRPFCPSIVADERDTYLAGARDERFMITSFDATSAARRRIPAVVHTDATVRPQLVHRVDNPLYYDLLRAYEKRSGDAVLLNSSLNVMGEPIVCTPNEAIRAFFDTGMDLLALGPFVVNKPGSRS